MKNQQLRTEYKVGAFVAIALIVAMISILVLGGNRIVFTRYMHLKTQFGEVQGLFPGSVISLGGLPVGNIKSIDFAKDSNRLEVFYQVDQKYSARITQGTTAEIRTQGALGDKYIYLEPGEPKNPVVADDTEIPQSVSNDIFSMLTSKEDGVGNVLGLVKELKTLLATFNANGRTGKILDNFNQAMGQFNKTLVQLDGMVTDIRGEIPHNHKLQAAVDDLAHIMQKIDNGQGTLGQLINDPTLSQSLKGFLGGSPRNTYLKNVIRDSIQQSEKAKK